MRRPLDLAARYDLLDLTNPAGAEAAVLRIAVAEKAYQEAGTTAGGRGITEELAASAIDLLMVSSNQLAGASIF